MNKFADLVDQLKQEYRDSLAWNAVKAGEEWNWNTTFRKISDVHWVLTVSRLPVYIVMCAAADRIVVQGVQEQVGYCGNGGHEPSLLG